MRIPRNIEWRAGIILVGVSAFFLGLLIVLALADMDVGMEVEGVMGRTQAGWTLAVEVPGERLRLLRTCRYVRIGSGKGRVWYGKISRIEGHLVEDSPLVLAEIEIQAVDATGVQVDSSQIVRANLLEEVKAPVLRVLFDSIFRLNLDSSTPKREYMTRP